MESKAQSEWSILSVDVREKWETGAIREQEKSEQLIWIHPKKIFLEGYLSIVTAG